MKKHIKDLLGKGNFTINGSLWLEGNGTRFLGLGPVELLHKAIILNKALR